MLQYANETFEYGVLDCCQFAAKVAEKIEGIDYSRLFAYASEAEAYEFISDAGNLKELVTGILGREPVDVASLVTGDPVLLQLPIVGEMIGIHTNEAAIVKTPKGAVKINLEKAVCGWSLSEEKE